MVSPPVVSPVRSRGGEIFRRFLIAHAIAYVPAFVCAAAWVPIICWTQFDTLMAIDLDERALKAFLTHRMLAPALVGFAVPHLLSLRWMIARDEKKGRTLALGGTALFTAAAFLFGVAVWIKLLSA